MCGIFGVIGRIAVDEAFSAFGKIAHRGTDGYGCIVDGKSWYASTLTELRKKVTVDTSRSFLFLHALHAIVGNVPQPFVSQNKHTATCFLANCEIYNWKPLSVLHDLQPQPKNDAELFFQLLQKVGVSALESVDGDYAFAYLDDEQLLLARDSIGLKPLVYGKNDTVFAFASEKKALTALDLPTCDVHPQEILSVSLKTKAIEKKKRRPFFRLDMLQQQKLSQISEEDLVDRLAELLLNAIYKRVRDLDTFGILFSGGVDSTLLAKCCVLLGKKPTLYTGAVDCGGRLPPDLVAAEQAAAALRLPLKKKVLTLNDAGHVFEEVVKTIESKDVMKVGVAAPFAVACTLAKEDGIKVLLSGIGSEELFAGYERHLTVFQKGGDVNEECLRGFGEMWERDLYRDDLITMRHRVELRTPFLDTDLISFAKDIPVNLKIGSAGNKLILRKAALHLGVPEAFALRKKQAAQYGSNFDKALEKLAKQKKFPSKKAYLESIH